MANQDNRKIRFAEVADLPKICRFISESWSSEHIFVKHPGLLHWQHENTQQDNPRLNFVVAFAHGKGGEPIIQGILGFIPTSKFSRSLSSESIALAIWKVSDSAKERALGLSLFAFLQHKIKPTFICAIGLSEMVKPLYKALKFQLGVMDHWALFGNSNETEIKVAKNVPKAALKSRKKNSFYRIHELEAESLRELSIKKQIDGLGEKQLPVKTAEYFAKKYKEHPWYKYLVFGVFNHEELAVLIVTRPVVANNQWVLRIVDFLGDECVLATCSGNMQQILKDRGFEYLDIVSHGLNGRCLEDAGFVSPSKFPEMIIPNYFAPFEQKNVVLDCTYKILDQADSIPVRLFRGDSDQDRPNSLRELGLEER